nr:kinetochore-associated protein KNL-2 homolog isoform X1 [Ipomoea batatas]
MVVVLGEGSCVPFLFWKMNEKCFPFTFPNPLFSGFRKTTRKNKNDASSAETHGPECKKNSKTKIGSKKGNRSEETENKACLQKNMNKAGRISQRFRSCYNKQNQTSEGGTSIDCKIASTPGSKAKRKLSYEEPLLENGRGEASAQSAEPSTSNDLRSEILDNNLRGNSEDETSKGENQKDGGVNEVVIQKNTSKAALGCARSATPGKNRRNGVSAVTSPQSLSYKRSRSGRLLLPPLKFWQNQRAIYDADRRVTGIVKDPDATI